MLARRFKFDVFLSHNRAQKDWTENLARRLRDDGFDVWFDKWILPQHAGRNWVDELREGVESSGKSVLVLSPEFFAGDWPIFESTIIQLIDPGGRLDRIIPLLHTPCEIPKHWAFRQALDFTNAPLGTEEFEFHYHHLIHNLDNSRPYEGDFEQFKKLKTGDANTIPPVRPLPPGSRMLQASNPLFVGREGEMRTLNRMLSPGSGALVGLHAAVIGMGGVGKTQLSVEYAHRYGHLYQGGVFWLNFAGEEDPINEVARCGGPEGMDISGWNEMKAPEQAARVQKAWEEGERASLLIFDNAEDPAAVEKWRPKHGHCSVLITCRRSDWPPEMGVHPLGIETLPREKSLELLAEVRSSINSNAKEHEAAEKICERLGDLPLALSVAAAYLRKYKSESVSQYLKALSDQSPIQDPSSANAGYITTSVPSNNLDNVDNPSPKTGDQLRVFLCHSSGDKPAVRKLYQCLKRDGFAPWLDEEDLIPGQDWRYEIPVAVRCSHAVVVCLSRGSITREGYVQKEIKVALDVADEKPQGTIFIIPALLEENIDVPERLSQWHWVNLFQERGYPKLVTALKARASTLISHPILITGKQLPPPASQPIYKPSRVVIGPTVNTPSSFRWKNIDFDLILANPEDLDRKRFLELVRSFEISVKSEKNSKLVEKLNEWLSDPIHGHLSKYTCFRLLRWTTSSRWQHAVLHAEAIWVYLFGAPVPSWYMWNQAQKAYQFDSEAWKVWFDSMRNSLRSTEAIYKEHNHESARTWPVHNQCQCQDCQNYRRAHPSTSSL